MPRSRVVKRIPLDDTFSLSQETTPSQNTRRSKRGLKVPLSPVLASDVGSILPGRRQRQSTPTGNLVETYETVPDKVSVYVPTTNKDRPFTAKENAEFHETAEHFLADSLIKGQAGDIRLLNERKKRKRHETSLQDGRVARAERKGEDLDLSVLWYSTRLSFPRIGDLQAGDKAWTPFIPPPLISDLRTLSPQSHNLTPPVGTNIPLWNVNPISDLDPVMDDVPDFEHRWTAANGSGWGMSSQDVYTQGSMVANVALGKEVSNEIASDSDGFEIQLVENNVLQKPTGAVVNKGKVKARADLPILPLPLLTVGREQTKPTASDTWSDVNPIRRNLGEAVKLPHAVPSAIGDDWEKQSRMRKQWWREECSKEGHGQLFLIVPRPHNLLPLPYTGGAKSQRPPNYNLPRIFTSSSCSHPFHPDLRSMVRECPDYRVYWSIPVSGPVIVPTYFDPIGSVIPLRKAPIPSSGYINKRILDHKVTHHGAPSIQWTSDLLRHFWESFAIPLHGDRNRPFGILSVMISGPKPDPFFALNPPPPLSPWSSRLSEPKQKGIIPVRPEMGDHIRIYCPLKHALSLRTWLHSIEVDLDNLSSSIEPIDKLTITQATLKDKKLYRMFDKARLVLVGQKGEALIVA